MKNLSGENRKKPLYYKIPLVNYSFFKAIRKKKKKMVFLAAADVLI